MSVRLVFQPTLYLLAAASLPAFSADAGSPLEVPQFKTQEEYIMWRYDHAPSVDSFSIKLKPGKEPRPRGPLSQKLLDELSALAGVKLRFWGLGGTDDWQRIRMDRYMTQKDAEVIAETLKGHSDLAEVGVDAPVYPMSDPLEAEQ